MAEAVVVGVAHHSNDGPRRLVGLHPHTRVDLDLLADGVLVGPVFVGQSLIDEHHAGSRERIGFPEIAPAQDGNLEDTQIAGRKTHPSAALQPFSGCPAIWKAKASSTWLGSQTVDADTSTPGIALSRLRAFRES